MATHNPAALSSTDKYVARQSSGYFLGPMPIQEFMRDTLPLAAPSPSLPSGLSVFDKVWRVSRHTSSNCKMNMVRRLVQAAKRLLPSCLLRAESDKLDPACMPRGDVGVYTDAEVGKPVTDLANLELFISVDPDEAADPFDDAPTLPSPLGFPFERAGARFKRYRLDLSILASAVLNLQPRTHVFSVLMFGRHARIMRWDASGALVTEAFDYTTTAFLSDFLHRFDTVSPPQRGHDPSVTPLDDPWPTSLAPPEVLTQLQSRDSSMETPRHRHFALMKIPDRDDATREHDFLVSFPMEYEPRSPFGRSTQPTLAYDISLERVVFVKQYWRAILRTAEKEGDIYALLQDHDVRNLPVFGKGNDVRDLATLTDVIQQREGRSWGFYLRDLLPYRRYRMSLNTVGRKVTEFTSSRELVSALRDAMICHDDAYFKANILHRDVSPGNIMINIEDGSGFLTDWDSCLNLATADTEARSERVGTWQYMAAERLLKPGRPHTVADDRESALWVLAWIAFLYAPFKSDQPLHEWLSMFSELREQQQAPPLGGRKKVRFIKSFDFDEDIEFDRSPGLHPLIIMLKRIFICRYQFGGESDEAVKFMLEVVDPEAWDARHGQLEYLSEEGSFVQLLNNALAVARAWPSDDPATLHPEAASRPKRTAADADLPNDSPSTTQKRRLTNNPKARPERKPRQGKTAHPRPPPQTALPKKVVPPSRAPRTTPGRTQRAKQNSADGAPTSNNPIPRVKIKPHNNKRRRRR